MQRKKQKRAVTLIEIMIVIVLIGLIGGALTLNMRGSLDKGKEFKTEQNMGRVYDALMMEYATGSRSLQEIVEDREAVMQACPFVKNGETLLQDAWGNKLDVSVDTEHDEVVVTSPRLHPNA